MTKKFINDDLTHVSHGILATLFLLPGMIIQRYMYYNTRGQRYGKVRESTRRARSNLFTWFYSILVWACISYFLFLGHLNDLDAQEQGYANAKVRAEAQGNAR